MNAPAPNHPAPSVKGWCPGVLRPMRSGDGLLARVRPRGAALSAEALGVLAGAARELGNGLIDLTSQGNIQLRGLDETGAAALVSRLAPLGLLDEDADAEARRNIIMSPLHGLDPTRLIDLAPLAAELAAQLREATGLASLPAKFTFLIDDGGALPLGDVCADLRFEARRGSNGVRFLVKRSGDSASAESVGFCAPEALARTAVSLARGVIDAAPPAPAEPPRCGSNTDDCLVEFDCGGTHCLGVLAPYGRLTAAMLDALGDIASTAARSEIRLTPWRAALVPFNTPASATALRARLADAGFTVTRGDPRARVAACVGSPACASATTDVRGDATFFSQVLRGGGGVSLHVSGCAKGCANAAPARITLVGRNGLYDFVRGGNAQTVPAERGLTREAAQARLSETFAVEEAGV